MQYTVIGLSDTRTHSDFSGVITDWLLVRLQLTALDIREAKELLVLILAH